MDKTLQKKLASPQRLSDANSTLNVHQTNFRIPSDVAIQMPYPSRCSSDVEEYVPSPVASASQDDPESFPVSMINRSPPENGNYGNSFSERQFSLRAQRAPEVLTVDENLNYIPETPRLLDYSNETRDIGSAKHFPASETSFGSIFTEKRIPSDVSYMCTGPQTFRNGWRSVPSNTETISTNPENSATLLDNQLHELHEGLHAFFQNMASSFVASRNAGYPACSMPFKTMSPIIHEHGTPSVCEQALRDNVMAHPEFQKRFVPFPSADSSVHAPGLPNETHISLYNRSWTPEYCPPLKHSNQIGEQTRGAAQNSISQPHSALGSDSIKIDVPWSHSISNTTGDRRWVCPVLSRSYNPSSVHSAVWPRIQGNNVMLHPSLQKDESFSSAAPEHATLRHLSADPKQWESSYRNRVALHSNQTIEQRYAAGQNVPSQIQELFDSGFPKMNASENFSLSSSEGGRRFMFNPTPPKTVFQMEHQEEAAPANAGNRIFSIYHEPLKSSYRNPVSLPPDQTIEQGYATTQNVSSQSRVPFNSDSHMLSVSQNFSPNPEGGSRLMYSPTLSKSVRQMERQEAATLDHSFLTNLSAYHKQWEPSYRNPVSLHPNQTIQQGYSTGQNVSSQSRAPFNSDSHMLSVSQIFSPTPEGGSRLMYSPTPSKSVRQMERQEAATLDYSVLTNSSAYHKQWEPSYRNPVSLHPNQTSEQRYASGQNFSSQSHAHFDSHKLSVSEKFSLSNPEGNSRMMYSQIPFEAVPQMEPQEATALDHAVLTNFPTYHKQCEPSSRNPVSLHPNQTVEQRDASGQNAPSLSHELFDSDSHKLSVSQNILLSTPEGASRFVCNLTLPEAVFPMKRQVAAAPDNADGALFSTYHEPWKSGYRNPVSLHSNQTIEERHSPGQDVPLQSHEPFSGDSHKLSMSQNFSLSTPKGGSRLLYSPTLPEAILQINAQDVLRNTHRSEKRDSQNDGETVDGVESVNSLYGAHGQSTVVTDGEKMASDLSTLAGKQPYKCVNQAFWRQMI